MAAPIALRMQATLVVAEVPRLTVCRCAAVHADRFMAARAATQIDHAAGEYTREWHCRFCRSRVAGSQVGGELSSGGAGCVSVQRNLKASGSGGERRWSTPFRR